MIFIKIAKHFMPNDSILQLMYTEKKRREIFGVTAEFGENSTLRGSASKSMLTSSIPIINVKER